MPSVSTGHGRRNPNLTPEEEAHLDAMEAARAEQQVRGPNPIQSGQSEPEPEPEPAFVTIAWAGLGVSVGMGVAALATPLVPVIVGAGTLGGVIAWVWRRRQAA